MVAAGDSQLHRFVGRIAPLGRRDVHGKVIPMHLHLLRAGHRQIARIGDLRLKGVDGVKLVGGFGCIAGSPLAVSAGDAGQLGHRRGVIGCGEAVIPPIPAVAGERIAKDFEFYGCVRHRLPKVVIGGDGDLGIVAGNDMVTVAGDCHLIFGLAILFDAQALRLALPIHGQGERPPAQGRRIANHKLPSERPKFVQGGGLGRDHIAAGIAQGQRNGGAGGKLRIAIEFPFAYKGLVVERLVRAIDGAVGVEVDGLVVIGRRPPFPPPVRTIACPLPIKAGDGCFAIALGHGHKGRPICYRNVGHAVGIGCGVRQGCSLFVIQGDCESSAGALPLEICCPGHNLSTGTLFEGENMTRHHHIIGIAAGVAAPAIDAIGFDHIDAAGDIGRKGGILGRIPIAAGKRLLPGDSRGESGCVNGWIAVGFIGRHALDKVGRCYGIERKVDGGGGCSRPDGHPVQAAGVNNLHAPANAKI